MSNAKMTTLEARTPEASLRPEGERPSRRNSDLDRSNVVQSRSKEDFERFALVAGHDLREPLRMPTVFAPLLAPKYRESPKRSGAEAQKRLSTEHRTQVPTTGVSAIREAIDHKTARYAAMVHLQKAPLTGKYVQVPSIVRNSSGKHARGAA